MICHTSTASLTFMNDISSISLIFNIREMFDFIQILDESSRSLVSARSWISCGQRFYQDLAWVLLINHITILRRIFEMTDPTKILDSFSRNLICQNPGRTFEITDLAKIIGDLRFHQSDRYLGRNLEHTDLTKHTDEFSNSRIWSRSSIDRIDPW